jgi:hypothetical protein
MSEGNGSPKTLSKVVKDADELHEAIVQLNSEGKIK